MRFCRGEVEDDVDEEEQPQISEEDEKPSASVTAVSCQDQQTHI